jgi:hypothetical protein
MLGARPGLSRVPPLSGQFLVRQRGHRPCRRRHVVVASNMASRFSNQRLIGALLRSVCRPARVYAVEGQPVWRSIPNRPGSRGTLQTTNHHLSDSAVALREKLMHGLPVRVVEVTNVDLKIMSRRTPTDNALGRRRSPGHRGPRTPQGTAGVGMRELRPPPGRIFGEGIDLVVAMTGFFDQLLTRLMTGGTRGAPNNDSSRAGTHDGEQRLQPRKDLHVSAKPTSSTCG